MGTFSSGRLLGIPNSLMSFWYLANRQQIAVLVDFDKRAFAYLIILNAPWEDHSIHHAYTQPWTRVALFFSYIFWSLQLY